VVCFLKFEELGGIELWFQMLDRLLGDVEHDVPFLDMDLSGPWDMGMQTHPHYFLANPVDEMPPIPDVMPGVDVPLTGTMLPLRDLTVAGLQRSSIPPFAAISDKQELNSHDDTANLPAC
jgi:hypothetical protein